jgi:hypothetical protein
MENNKKQEILISLSSLENLVLNCLLGESEKEKKVYHIIDRNITSIKKQIKNL